MEISTDQYTSSKFRPHGTMSIVFKDGIHYCLISGPLNAEFMRAYTKMWGEQYKALEATGKPKKIIAITEWSDSLLCPPDVLEYFGKIMTATANLGFLSRHVWYVPKDIEGEFFMIPLWKQYFDGNMQRLEVFDNKENAIKRIFEIRDEF